MTALLDIEAWRAKAATGTAPEATLYKFADSEPTVVAGATARTRRFIFSTGDIDHSNDVIRQDGWDLSVFSKNSVALFAHDASALPVGKASNVAVRNNKLIGDITFAGPDQYPFADTVFQLVKGGYLSAVSVGFLPKEFKFSSDKNRPFGVDFTKSLLVEISIVPVPANPQALIAARAAGVDTRPLKEWAERILDGGAESPMSRKLVEGIRRQAAEPVTTKSGRRLSAATRATLQESLDHHDKAMASLQASAAGIRSLMSDADDPDAPAPDEAQDEAAPDVTSRLREVVALKAGLAADALAAKRKRLRPASPQTVGDRIAAAAEIRRTVADLVRR